MSDKTHHNILITVEAADALHKEKTLKDRTYSKTILRILEELDELRRYKKTTEEERKEHFGHSDY